MTDDGQIAAARRRRRWHARRDVRFVMVIGSLLAIFVAYGYVTGPSRISDRLAAALADGPPRLNIVVTAKFPPEEFHMGVYQDVGAMRGSQGRNSTLFRVKSRDVRALSRRYWIERIDLAPG